MSRLTRPAVAAAALLVVAVSVVIPTSVTFAAAPDECDALVLDPGHHIDVPRVTRAARRVQDQAADVRVRVYDSVPGGDLDAYVHDLADRCPTWQDTVGGVQTNLVVLAVSVGDRRSGLYYGDTYAPALSQEWSGIQAEAINPRFGAGDFTGGLVAGLRRVAHFVDPEYLPPEPSDPTDEGIDPGIDLSVVTDDGNETGASAEGSGVGGGGGVVLGVLIGIAALVGVVFGGVAARRRHLATVAAREKASTARGEMATAFLELEETSELASARVAALPAVEDSGVRAAHALGERAKAAEDAATNDYLAVEEANGDEAIAAMRTAQATAAAQAMDAATAKLAAAVQAWAAAEAKVDELEQLRAELPAQMETVDGLVAQTRDLFPARDAAGFHTADFVAAVDGYAAEAAAVRELLSQMRFGDADGRADALLDAARATYTRVDDLPALVGRLVADVAELRATASAADRNLVAAREIAANLMTGYQSECSKGVPETLASAVDTVGAVRVAADEVETAGGMDVQRFADAEAAAARGHELATRAAAEIAVPSARKAELEALNASLRSRLTELQASCAVLAAKVAERQDAVAYLDQVPDCAGVGAQLDGLTSDVAADRPALYAARDGVDAAERALTAGHESVDGVIALFDKAEQRVGKAADAVDDAESESGRMGSGSRSRGLADEARGELEEARAAADLRERIEHADAAIAAAQNAVDEARRARQASRRRNGAFALGAGAGVGAGGGSGASSGGGGMGGGSSSFGGGGGDMGGGSSSFGGGGGDMGGGSSSW